MGVTLAQAFLEAGHPVTVWNRTAAKAKALEAKGVRVAPSLEAAVAEAEIVVGNVNDYASTTALLEPPAVASALRGRLFVQLATGTPKQARATAAWAQEHGIAYLDGAIMATPVFIGQRGCTILYSGGKELFEANREVFAVLGGNALHVGIDIGHANALDAALLVVLWGSLFGTWQAAAICEAEGFPLEAFLGSLGATMPVIEDVLKDSVKRIAGRRFVADEATASTVEICYASARLIREISAGHGIHLGLPEALEQIFKRASDAGRGQEDLAAVYLGMRG